MFRAAKERGEGGREGMVRLWWGSGGVGKNGVGNGWRVGGMEGGSRVGGIGSQGDLGSREMLCYGGRRVYGSNWGAKFPVASL